MSISQAATLIEYIAFALPPHQAIAISKEFLGHTQNWHAVTCYLTATPEMIKSGLVACGADMYIGAIGHHDPIHCNYGRGFEEFLLQRKFPERVELNGEERKTITPQHSTSIALKLIELGYRGRFSCFSEYYNPLFCRINVSASLARDSAYIQFEYFGDLREKQDLLAPLLHLCQKFQLKQFHLYMGTAYKEVQLSSLLT